MSRLKGPKSALKLYRDYANQHGYSNIGNIPFAEKFEEFEIINDNEIDFISLNSLYDYYRVDYNEEDIKHFMDTTIMCENCYHLVSEVFPCEKCEIEICDKCQTPYNQFTQVDYTCCKSCSDPI